MFTHTSGLRNASHPDKQQLLTSIMYIDAPLLSWKKMQVYNKDVSVVVIIFRYSSKLRSLMYEDNFNNAFVKYNKLTTL